MFRFRSVLAKHGALVAGTAAGALAIMVSSGGLPLVQFPENDGGQGGGHEAFPLLIAPLIIGQKERP